MSQSSLTLYSRTGRLKLVTPSAANDQAVSELRSHPQIRKYLRYLPEHFSIEDARSRRQTRSNDQTIEDLHIQLMNEDGSIQFIGSTGVFNIDTEHHSCEVGILVSPDLHRGGVATDVFYTLLSYVFEEKHFHRVAMQTSVDNVGMRGWLEKVAGAQLEMRKRDCWVDQQGGYTDVVGYSILDWEWRDTVKDALEKRLGL